MGTDVPLISSYKRKFLKRRLLQTALGGLRLLIAQPVPCYIYLTQLLLFLFPPLLALVFTLLYELTDVSLLLTSCIYGSIILLYTLTTNLISHCVCRQTAAIQSLTGRSHNPLSEDDDVDFDSCCDVPTVSFLLPGRKYLVNVFLHSVLVGPVSALGFWYLLPSEICRLYGDNLSISILLSVLGWLSLTIALYSLTSGAPPESATFRATDPVELTQISRPFHCLLLFSVFISAKYLTGFHLLLLADQVLHCIFAGLPMLWLLGWFPPVDALILWGLEQVHVFVCGGSAMSSDKWTMISLVLTSLCYTTTLLIPSFIPSLVTCSCLGYLLSTDLPHLYRTLPLCFSCGRVAPTEQEVLLGRAHQGFLWRCGVLECCLMCVLLLLVGGVTAVVTIFTVDRSLQWVVTEYVGYGIIGLYMVQWILSELQKVYMLWGMVRNPLYLGSLHKIREFRDRKRKSRVLGLVRRVIINFVGPFTMLTYLAMVTHWSGKEFPWRYNNNNNTRVGIWEVVAVSRAFRWIWQCTPSALLEISLVHLVHSLLPTHESPFLPLGLTTQLMVIGLLRDRFTQLCHKLYLVTAILVSSWTDTRRRRSKALLHLLLNLILSPLVLLIVVMATLISAPLLPLFTLPIFLLGYPRLLRVWPGPVGQAASEDMDTVVYQQSLPELGKVVRGMVSSGSLGEPSPGSYYLLRWEDRLAWIQILERGYLYTKISLKGLELQETSCHTEEAARIDEIIETTYNRQGGHFKCCKAMWNPYPLNILRPLDAEIVDTYSESRNQLTGVIDSPDVLKSIGEDFVMTLTWLIVGHVYWHHRNAEEGHVPFDPDEWECYHLTRPPPGVGGIEIDPTDQKRVVRPCVGSSNTTASLLSKHSLERLADDQDSLLMQSLDSRSHNPIGSGTSSQGTVTMETAYVTNDPYAMTGRLGTPGEVNDLLDELNSAPRPAAVVAKQHDKMHRDRHKGGLLTSPCLSGFEVACKSQHSVKMLPPPHWKYLPLDTEQMPELLGGFQADWYRHVVSLLRFKPCEGSNSQQIAAEIAADDVLQKMVAQVVMGCCAAVNHLGVAGDLVKMGPSHVQSIYSGCLPQSVVSDWILENPELYSLTIQAYRLTVKLSIDQFLLGPVSSLQDLHDNLQTYDRKWYIGMETEKGWKQAIRENRPNLFSLMYNSSQRTYQSRVLSVQPVPVYVGSLNSEAVRAQWANLNLEMLYMTNDDEERYSIQAQPTLLRNLTVQAADPPLGYPVYSSQPLHIPTL